MFLLRQFLFSIAIFSFINHGLGKPINPEEKGPYFQGDIIRTFQTKSGRLNPKYRWFNRTIFYEFEPGYPIEQRKTFFLAIQHISLKTCLKFEPKDYQSDYLFVVGTVSVSCFSYVGRQGGKQLISLPQSCHNLGTFIHEILHSVGFHHEHSRTDRDDFVSIIWENVSPGKDGQFRKYDAATVSSFGVPYDYNSILHYSRDAFSRSPGKLDTIVPKTNSNASIGQRKGMSIRDVEKVNRMYGCKME